MLYGIGCDLCEIAHLEKSLTGAHAAAFIRRCTARPNALR